MLTMVQPVAAAAAEEEEWAVGVGLAVTKSPQPGKVVPTVTRIFTK